MHREAVELSRMLAGESGVSQPVIDAMKGFGNAMLDEIVVQFDKLEGDSLQTVLQLLSKLEHTTPLFLNTLTMAGFCSCPNCHPISAQLTEEISTESTKKVVASAKQLHTDLLQLMKDMSFGSAPEFASVQDEISKRKDEQRAEMLRGVTEPSPENEQPQNETGPEPDCQDGCANHETCQPGQTPDKPQVQGIDLGDGPSESVEQPSPEVEPQDGNTTGPSDEDEQDIPKED